MNWLTKIFRRKPHAIAPPVAAPDFPAWTHEDVINLGRFLATATGQRLLAKAHAMEYNRAVTLPRDTFNCQHNAGVIVGVTDTINWLQQQAQLIPISQESGALDSMTGDTDQSDDALLKHYSP